MVSISDTKDNNGSKLVVKYGLTVDDIESFSKGTAWGWNGCDTLLARMNMCLNEVDPPMPASPSNAGFASPRDEAGGLDEAPSRNGQ